MEPFFTPATVNVAFESRFHFCWYARGRQATLGVSSEILERSLHEVAQRRNYHILEYEGEPQVLRVLLSLTPEQSPSEVTRFIKGSLGARAREESGLTQLWSRGWFVRSVGHVTGDVVRNYVARQYEHHDAARPGADAKARYQHPGDPCRLRASNHAKFEYNIHVVFVTARRREFLDLEVAEALVAYWRQVCEKKQWIPWDINVVWNHAHLFLGLSPRDAPGDAALSLLNNAEYFLERRYSAAWRDEIDRTVWRPGYYVGTAGSATTAQVKAFLARARVEGV